MPIDKTQLAIVTPSYHIDYEPCRLLVDSVNRYVEDSIIHYLIVPKNDYYLFRHLESYRTKVLFQEDFLPRWIIPFPISKKWYLSLKTLPVRGWIRQQIVKLSIGELLPEPFFLIIDSDTFFVKKFCLENFVREDNISLYCEPLKNSIPEFDVWQRTSADIFNLNGFNTISDIYVAPFIFWKKQILKSMFHTIEIKQNKSWQRVLCGQLRLSEYTLYGIYVSQVLGLDNSGHYNDPVKHTHDYYDHVPLSLAGLVEFKKKMKEHHVAVSISSKSLTRLNDIRAAFEF